MQAELILDAKATLGEGPIWDAREQCLYWVDIEAGRLHVFAPGEGTDHGYELGEMIGTVVPRRAGGVMLAMHHGFAAFDPRTGRLTRWGDPEAHLPRNRFNDGKCDPAGRFWAGTSTWTASRMRPACIVWNPMAAYGRCVQGVTNSNGIAWSLDGTAMYYIDTPTRQVTEFDYDLPSGQIANPRTVITVPADSGKPDGMTIDAEGMLWIALWGGGCVGRWDPRTGELACPVEVAPGGDGVCFWWSGPGPICILRRRGLV